MLDSGRILTEEITLQRFGDFAFQIDITLSVVKGFLFGAGTFIMVHGLVQCGVWTATLAADLGQVLQVLEVDD